MNKKYLFIVLTVSILLVGLGVASANTDYDDDTTIDKYTTTSNSKSISEDKNVKKISNEVTNQKSDQEKNLQTKSKNITKNRDKQNYKTVANTENVNNFSSLKDAMTSTLYDEVTINITDNITLESSIDLSKSIIKLNINGNGRSIDGYNQYYFIKTTSAVDLTLNNLKIVNCKSTGSGGAIYLSNSGAKLGIENCEFHNCTSENGGAIYTSASTTTVTNSNFTLCNATTNGGAIYAATTIIENSNFRNCTSGSGGAIHASGPLHAKNSNFTNNEVTGSCGAISSGNIIVEDCYFIQNIAGYEGGAIGNSKTTVIRSHFIENRASRYAAMAGRNHDVINSTFIRNDGGDYCAGFFGESLNITNSRFEDNRADYSAVFMVSTYLNLTDSTFINNTASNNRGGVFQASYIGGTTVCYLDNNKFINNTAGTNGGVIDAFFNVKMNLTNNVFMGNHAGGDGGAIYAFHRSYINSSNNVFQENYADNLGGAIYTYSGYAERATLNSTNNTYDKNHARQGGAIYTSYGSIVNSTQDIYSNNTADELGGALLGGSGGSIINIEETNFTENKATKGGAICGITPTKINNTNFTDNSASFGGAIEAIGTMKISNSTFTNNTALDDGGAVYGRNTSNVAISDTIFTENSAICYGGAISAYKRAEFSVTNNNFVNNTARYAGAVYGYLESTIDIQNSNFTENSADNGGAIGTNGTVTISYSNFTGNYADDTGGAIECESDLARLTVQASNFTDNYVKSNDGYVVDFSKSKYVVVKGNTFKNNTDDKRDMLFSEVNNLAISDINGNDYVDNYLKTIITPLDDVEIKHKNDITFKYPVNVTLRSVYNHTINTGSVVYEYNDISNSSDVRNNQSDISVHNKDLQLPVNMVNYKYQSLNKNYQSSNDKFKINKLISTKLEIQLEPQDKVNVGETVKVTITLEDIDGTRLADHEIEVEVNGIPYDLGDNNKTDVNGQLIFDYLVESFTINNIPGEIVFTAKHLETRPESYYDSAENIENVIRINEMPTHIHIDYNKDDVREGNTFNVTVLLCTDESSHEHIVGELVHYKITNMDETSIISEGNFTSTEEGYNITIENLPEEGYKVFASFDGSDLYDKSAEETDIIPNYIGTEVEIIIPTGNVYVNQTKTITIKLEDSNENLLPDDHVVFVTINNGEEIRVPVVSGVGTFNHTSNISTEINITARFNKTNTYSGSRGNGTYHVLKLPTHTTLELINDKVGNTTIKATVLDTINNKAVNSGNVTITLPDGRNITEQIENEEAIFHITTIMEGEYDLEAKFNGIDLVYIPSDQNTHKINIIKTPTETIMQNMTVMVTEKTITINVEVKDENKQKITSGTVLITVNEKTIPAPINDGKANITINNLPKGKYTINATYAGNGTYETSNTTATLNVLPEPTKSQVKILDTTLGNVTIKVTVTDLNDNKVTIGNVTLMDGQGLIISEQKEIKLTNGEAIIKIPATTTGLTKIKVHYNENEIYGESEAVDEDGNNPINIDVTRIPTITKIETLNATFSNVKIRVTVTNKTGEKVPEGMIIIRYGNGGTNATEIRNGIAEFNIPAENVGTIIVRAQYDGTEKYLPSRARNESLPIGDLDEYDHKIEVTPLETQITTTAKNGTNTKTSVDIALKDEQGRDLSNAPVTIKTLDGTIVATDITNNKGQVNIPVKLPVGNTPLNVEFAGNSTHKASNTTTQITTDKHNTTINAADNGNGTVTIKLTDEDKNIIPNKLVIISNGGKPIAQGITKSDGTITLPVNLPPGDYNININSPEDKNYRAANKTIPVSIPPKASKLNTTVLDSTRGNTTIKIELKDADGKQIPNAPVTVTLPNGTKKPATTNANGIVTLPLDLPVGTNNIKVDYPGNRTYKPISQTTQVNVQKTPTTTTITVINNTAGNVRVTGTVKDKYGRNVNEGIITIKNGNTNVGAGKVTNGAYTITTNMASKGTYTLKAEFAETNNYLSSSSTTTVTVNPKTPTLTVQPMGTNVGNTSIIATLKDPEGKPIGNAPVTVTLPNGTKITGTTNNNGVLNIPIDLREGNNNLTINYPGNATYNPVTAKTNMKVSKNDPIIKLDPVRGVIGEDITLTAYLTGVNGEKITGGNLVFKLNGKSLRNDGRFDSNAPAMKLSVKDGKVTITLKADLYLRNAKNLTASYSGNYKYKETNSPTVEAQIQKRYANLTVTATPTKQKQYQTITFTATVKDTTRNGKNTTLINQNTSVMFKVNGNTLKDAKGQIIYVPVDNDLKASYNYLYLQELVE